MSTVLSINQVDQSSNGLKVLQIATVKHIIDCDANPYVPNGWKSESHRKHGMFNWNQKKIHLYLPANRKLGKCIEGKKLQKEVENQPIVNANVLDYLLVHPELIPESWKGEVIFFWATIYRDSFGRLCVRCLYWNGNSWRWIYHWIDDDLRSSVPAAIFAK